MADDRRLAPTDVAQEAAGVETAGQATRRIYADWMVSTLERFYGVPSEERPTSLEFQREQIQLGDSMSGVLKTAYERVPEEIKLPFRQAIGDALSTVASYPSRDGAVDALGDLIQLVGKVKATEALTQMASVVGNEEIGKHKSLCVDTLAALGKFSSPEDNDIETRVKASLVAINLINNRSFDDDYLCLATGVNSTL